MNCSYRSIWNDTTGTFVAVSENATSAGKKTSSSATASGSGARFGLNVLAVAVMLAFGVEAYALPAGGVVAAGAATIGTAGTTTTINQSTQNAVINWQSFNIAAGETVQFVQPSTNSVTLNRVAVGNPSSILGSLTSNGRVFLVNPSGILFGQNATVNVGGLVASTLDITDADFNAGVYKFTGAGGSVSNLGTISANAPGGYVSLLGGNVSNDGTITANLGKVALAAGDAITLDMAGDSLLNVTVDTGIVNALVQNGNLIQADGGQVIMTTQAAGSLLQSAVNNTGVVRAQTLVTGEDGSIKLMSGMLAGAVNVDGTLDASAPNGGNGGLIETSAASVNVANSAIITTAAALGQNGTWLINPLDFTVGSAAGDNITGATLSAQLVDNNITIGTVDGSGARNIYITEAISWNGANGISANPTTLTLNALGDVNIGRNSANIDIPAAEITAVNGNLVVCCGNDVNVLAAITTTDGSVLLAGGNDVNLNAAITTTRGNMTMCAGNDLNLDAAIVLTDIAAAPERSLGLANGLVLSAGNNGTGPGTIGGTVNFAPGMPPAAITRAPVQIFYNPVSYATPTDYSGGTFFTLVGPGATVTQYMLVFPDGADKTFDGNTTASFTSLKGAPVGVTLTDNIGSEADFDTVDVGENKTVSFTGYTLAQGPTLVGGSAINYAFASSCCGPVVQRTTATIRAEPVVVLPPPDEVLPPPDVVLPPPDVVLPPPDETGTTVPGDTESADFDSPRDELSVDENLRSPLVRRPARGEPGVVLAPTPPQLLTLAPVEAPPPPPPPVVREEVPVVVPAPPPPKVYVAPVRPRIPERN